jgi:hypothetical protein
MTHTEREWRDGQPGGTGPDESTGLAEQVPGDDPLVEERVHDDDPLVEEVHEPAGLGSAGDQERFVVRWQEIQAGFVDEPRRAVEDADALVVDMMDRLARMLASERERLGSFGETAQVSTEDLRQGLQRYRALYEWLLAIEIPAGAVA